MTWTWGERSLASSHRPTCPHCPKKAYKPAAPRLSRVVGLGVSRVSQSLCRSADRLPVRAHHRRPLCRAVPVPCPSPCLWTPDPCAHSPWAALSISFSSIPLPFTLLRLNTSTVVRARLFFSFYTGPTPVPAPISLFSLSLIFTEEIPWHWSKLLNTKNMSHYIRFSFLGLWSNTIFNDIFYLKPSFDLSHSLLYHSLLFAPWLSFVWNGAHFLYNWDGVSPLHQQQQQKQQQLFTIAGRCAASLSVGHNGRR